MAEDAGDPPLAKAIALVQSGRASEGVGLLKAAWFDPLRAMSAFTHIVRRAEESQREALAAFRAADGPRVLGVPHL